MQEAVKKYMVFKEDYGTDYSKRFLYDKDGSKSKLISTDRYKEMILGGGFIENLSKFKEILPYIIKYFASYYLNS